MSSVSLFLLVEKHSEQFLLNGSNIYPTVFHVKTWLSKEGCFSWHLSTHLSYRGSLPFLKFLITEIASTVFYIKCKLLLTLKDKKKREREKRNSLIAWGLDQYKINIAGTMKLWNGFIIKTSTQSYKCCQNKQEVPFRLSSQVFLLSANSRIQDISRLENL